MSKITKNERIHALEQQVKGLIDGYKILSRHVDCTSEYKPKLKQLDQSVFDGSHEMWKFAAVDADGAVFKFARRPYLTDDYWSNVNRSRFDRVSAEGIYDTSNWQNSLIERESKELTGSELCKAMLARGDKYVMCIVNDCGLYNTLRDKPLIVISHCENGFYVRDSYYGYAMPINNQGEPLTAKELGL